MKSIFRERPDPAELRPRIAGWLGKLWVWWPVIVMLIIIRIESTNTFSAENTSPWIRSWVERFTGHINDTLWQIIHHLVRKSGHFTGYGLLCLAWLRGWLLTLALRPGIIFWRSRAVGCAIAGTFLIASLDEWHQTFIPSRTGNFHDVLLDTTGGATMCALVWLIFWRTRAMRRE